MSAVVTQQAADTGVSAAKPMEIRVYSHSMLFYWWPVWAVGYLFALLTWMRGVEVTFEYKTVLIHPSHNLGAIYTIVFLIVMLMTHVAVRGVASLSVILGAIAFALLCAYMDWWDDILRALGNLAIFMNLGFYIFFSTAVFTIWASTVFFFDRFDYWLFRPGQAVHHNVMGGGEHTYDTHGMSVVKMRDDMFRHWILGLGSGDLHIAATGALKGEFVVSNVLFVGTKLERIQELVAMKPDEATQKVVTAGEPI